KFPKRIGIVTSPSGAAIRDILNVLRRRAPWLQILISPVRVQGTGAAQEIAVAIRELAKPNENFAPVELIVVTRGGGSMEDLWEFNEEIVAPLSRAQGRQLPPRTYARSCHAPGTQPCARTDVATKSFWRSAPPFR